VTIYTSHAIAGTTEVSLSRGGLILIALLSGGDYCPAGLPGCGTSIAYGLACAGFGDSLLAAALALTLQDFKTFLVSWREQLCAELMTNASGCLSQKCPALAKRMPDSFPNVHHILLYAKPLTSWSEGAAGPDLSKLQPRQPDITKLATICKHRFNWEPTPGILKKFESVLWDGVCIRMLCEVSNSDKIDSAIQSQQSNEFVPSAVRHIRLSKLESAANNLKFYRVDISTSALTSLTKQGLGQPEDTHQPPNFAVNPKNKHAVWVPAPIIERALPELVGEYNRLTKSEKKWLDVPQKPVCIVFKFTVILCCTTYFTRFWHSFLVIIRHFKVGQTIPPCTVALPHHRPT